MRLHYFKSTDTLEELKQKRNALVKVYHPDKNKNSNATAIMQLINTEYDYLLQHHKELPKIPFTDDSVFLKKASQNIFHALTNANAVDYNLLIQTISNISPRQIKPLTVIYFKQYGIQLLNHIQDKVKDKKIKDSIIISIKIATGTIGFIDVFKFFKTFK